MIFEDTLLGRDEFIKHAAKLAVSHHVVKREGNVTYLPDVEACAAQIRDTYQRITSEYRDDGYAAMPAEEWIVDNYHKIQEQIDFFLHAKAKRSGLFSRGPLKGLPVIELYDGKVKRCALRIYTVASEIIAHTDGHPDESAVTEFVDYYQKTAPLTTAELCELPTMLRLSLLMRLSSVCAITDRIQSERETAEHVFERYISYISSRGGDGAPAGTRRAAAREAARAMEVWLNSIGDLTPVFAESILRLAAKWSEDTGELREILSRKLAGRGTTLDQMISAEHSTRIALGMSAGNIITGMSDIDTLNWDDMLMRLSTVEQILLRDPAGVFGKMTRESRAEYVRLVDAYAYKMKVSPESVALTAVELASETCGSGYSAGEPQKCHAGYYIAGRGIRILCRRLSGKSYRPRGYVAARAFMAAVTIAVTVITFAPGVLLILSIARQYQSAWAHVLLALLLFPLLFITAANFAIGLVQRVFAHLYPPVSLPALNFRAGIPQEYAVMVIIPAVLSDPSRTAELVRQLEVAALANPSRHIYYAIVGDFKDSSQSREPEDEEILRTGRLETQRLNQRYCAGEAQNRFFFFWRDRIWYERENKWMGHERKRGAVMDLNALLLKGSSDVLKGAEAGMLPKIKYVLTIDADTVIPTDTVRTMAEIMAHPLNAPVVSYRDGGKIVMEGYGILQPAVTPAMSRQPLSAFTRVFSDEPGTDSYCAKTSDFFFDACGEGIFTGKGMYDPAVFNGVLEDVFQDETILSHDLIEGSYLRTAFSSEIHLYDQYPGSYEAYMKRLHRWTRGDWQLLPYKKAEFVGRMGKKQKNPLTFLSLFKMNLNLLRSMAAPAVLLLFLLGSLILPGLMPFWYAVILLYEYLPFLLSPSRKGAARCTLELLFLPYEAYMMADAAVRTLWRVYISKRNLLSWVTASEAERGAKGSLRSYFMKMAPSCFGAAAALMLFLMLRHVSLLWGVLAVFWLAGPCIAWRLSRKPAAAKQGFDGRTALPPSQQMRLGMLGRKIWAFYEDFSGPGDHWLPPDNVQFKPVYSIAHRTSPTNIGFLILSAVIANNMGYIRKPEMCRLISNVMDTLDKLEKWNGHIYNWYDTISLCPLEPIFISTVDSGNLMACMLCAAEIIRSRAARPEGPRQLATGLLDLLYTLNEYALPENKASKEPVESFLHDSYATPEQEQEAWRLVLGYYEKYCESTENAKNERADAQVWRQKLKKAVKDGQNDPEDPNNLCSELLMLAERLNRFALNMNFTPLYNCAKGLFSTGFGLRENKLANSHYDILVSEARLTSYLAVAKGDVPPEHFRKMSRKRAENGDGILQSWSGTAFEYLLPELFLPAYPGSIWDTTIRLMLDGQIRYGAMLGIPWGISESGYHAMDLNMNYKYKAFGVPGLGVKRGLAEDLVAAPYASLMAIAHKPREVMENTEQFRELGACGLYGLYEAVDFTKGRKGIVASYMAHHLGMSFVGIANYLHDGLVAEAFLQIPLVASAQTLIAERNPKGYGKVKWQYQPLREKALPKESKPEGAEEEDVREFASLRSGLPDCHLLSNGEYTVMITADGLGYSAVCGVGVNRWFGGYEEDYTGVFIYIKNLTDGRLWSAAKYPVGSSADKYKVSFYPERAVFHRWDGDLESRTEVCVSPEEGAEIRKIVIANHGGSEMILEITGFTELTLTPWLQQTAHPAFSDLFITTEAVTSGSGIPCLIAEKMQLNAAQPRVYACFAVSEPGAEDGIEGSVGYDTDLATFMGRRHDASLPAALHEDTPLAGRTGTVLTPCFALRTRCRIPAGGSTELFLTLGVGKSREEALRIADKYRYKRNAERAFELARTRCMIEREHTGLHKGERKYFLSLLPKLVYPIDAAPGRVWEGDGETTLHALWRLGISGDDPIITVIMKRIENTEALERMVRMWCFYSFRGLRTDLAIVTFDNNDYLHPLRDLADHLAVKALSGYFAVRGNIYVVAPKDGESVKPLLSVSRIIFWL